MRLYKYRATVSLERTLDILINARLYAAQFMELNDPMEGVYQYDDKTVKPEELARFNKEKRKHRLVSLSETYASTLMWSYYADGHQGVVIGVEVNATNYEILPVRYLGPGIVKKMSRSLAKDVLSRKHKHWQHERERRVFTVKANRFVPIQVREIILGVDTKPTIRKIIEAVAAKYCPGIKPRRLRKSELGV